MSYPTEEQLEKIRNCPVHRCADMLELIKATWDHETGRIQLIGRTLKLSTGGWSGNEDVVEALAENQMFWGLYWQKSLRGGYFEFKFELPKETKDE